MLTFEPRRSALCARRYARAMSSGAPAFGPVRNLIGDGAEAAAVADAVAVSRPLPAAAASRSAASARSTRPRVVVLLTNDPLSSSSPTRTRWGDPDASCLLTQVLALDHVKRRCAPCASLRRRSG